jgi:PAS domain-containing protein
VKGGCCLTVVPGWMEGGDRGVVIVPGDAEASPLIQAVRYKDADLQMPPDRPLVPEEIAALEQWIQRGAPDPRDYASVEPDSGPSPSDPVAGRQHWAFRPLEATPPPNSTMANTSPRWLPTPIDGFIQARLDAESLPPAPDADRRTLVRRLYIQLIGLPPTPQQISEFLEDSRPDSRERLVDQLLASPHFGERWGRHWLDLARYADSNGLDENFLFREAWRYRNGVIASINADQPFDRFVLEQIAGDLLPFDSLEQRDRQRIAAGFLVVGPKVLLGVDPHKQKMEVADEQLDTIGRVFLGQTIGCARCHDHKFDPIPTADYYALAGIFTSTSVMETRYMLGEQRLMERLTGLGADGEELETAYEQYWRELPKIRERHKQAQAAIQLLEADDAAALAAHIEKHQEAVAPKASDGSLSRDERLGAQRTLLAELQQVIASPPPIPPRAMIPAEAATPSDESIRLAGQFDRLGQRVPRGVLRVLRQDPLEMPSGQSGRVELARWLTETESGAGQLAARVLANRVWHYLIGRGIVRTVDNFGRTGEAPTHPELLDYLAVRLIASGWSVKSLVREIALSQVFARATLHDDLAHEIDPDNTLLWRAHRRRLEPETLRDAMLMAAGELDFRSYDSTVGYLGDQATAVGDNKNRRRTDFPCRSVYLPVIRNDLPEIFEAFDFADPHATTGMRPETTVATQGLFLLNDESVMQAATAAARRFLSRHDEQFPTVTIDRMFAEILHVPPTDGERETMLTFVHEMEKQLATEGPEEARLRAWSLVCHALIASSRFQFVE